MTQPVGWGVLGAGRISNLAVGPALAASPSCRLVAIGARDQARAEALAGRLASTGEAPARACCGYEPVLADRDVDVVYIALPNDAHVPWIVEAVRAGKHVLCEKPLGLTRSEVAAAFDAGDVAGRLVVEASWNRWHPRTRDAERLVADGEVGAVTAVDSGFAFSGVPATDYRMDPAMGGGALYDVGCYALAAVGWATGWAPVSASAAEVRVHPAGVDLAITGHLRIGTVEATVRAGIDEPERQWLKVTGTTGSITLATPAFTAWTGGPARLEVRRTGQPVEVRRYPPCDPYRSMVEGVADRIRGGTAWVVPRRDSEWVAAAIDRLRDGGRTPG